MTDKQPEKISPDRLRIIAELIRPNASDHWLRGFEIAVDARPGVTEAGLLASAPFIDSEASAYTLGFAAGASEAALETDTRFRDFDAALDARMRAMAARYGLVADDEFENIEPKTTLN